MISAVLYAFLRFWATLKGTLLPPNQQAKNLPKEVYYEVGGP